MRKFLLSLTVLIAGAMSAAVTVPTKGVYTIEGGVTGQHRGFMVAGKNITTHPVLDEIGWSNYANNNTSAIENGKYWYVVESTTQEGKFFIYNLGLEKFIVAGTGNQINFSDTPYLWTIVVNGSNDNYNSIRDTRASTFLCFACGKSGQNRNVHFNNEEGDGGSMHTFTAVEDGETTYAEKIKVANEILRSYHWPSYAKTVTVRDRITDFSTVEDGQTVVFKIVNHNRYITIGEDCNAKMSADVTGFNVFKLRRVGDTQTFNFESARKGYYFPQLQNSGWPTYTMQETASPVAFEFLSVKSDNTELTEGQFVVKSTTANAYFDGDANNFTGWQGKDANCVYEVYKVSCSEDKYFIGDFDFTVIDDLGNSYTGTTRGALGETPTSLPFTGVVGYTLANEEWTNENTSYTANIKFPFAISNENVTNVTTIASVGDTKKWCATDNGAIMVKASDYDANNNAWLWAIYPQFDNGAFTFKIKNVGLNKWIYTNAIGSKVDGYNNNDAADGAADAVQLTDEGTAFAVVKSNDVVGFHYRVDDRNQYLSINSSNDTKVFLGVHSGIHTGTDCRFGFVKTVVEALAGEGTEASPYLINNVNDLVCFRNSVNAGETTYNAEGVYVALGADIDLAGQDWSVNIGDDCNFTFDGIFDGKNHTISNLTSTESASKSYICTGLFGAIYGNAVVKNLTIANVNISTGTAVGNNASAVVGFAYSCTGSIENVTVTGNININAPAVTGVGAILGYDYYSPALKVENCKVIGAEGSSIVGGKAYVGGLVGYASSKIAMNGNTVENVTVTGTGSVGAIAGIMLVGGSAADNTVKNVAVSATGDLWANSAAVVAGTMTSNGTVTISNTTVDDVTINGAVVENEDESIIVGGILVEKPTESIAKVEAKIGDTYYSTLADAVKAEGDVELLIDATLEDGVAYVNANRNAVTGNITYTRKLTAYWNPIYLPFEVVLSTADYDVAEFTSAEGTTLTLTKVKGETATLVANKAYVIRPKTEEAKTLTIELKNPTLEAASVESVVLGDGFSVKGNYSKLTGADLAENDRVVGTNGNWGVLKSASTLKPYRLILTIPAGFDAASISMRVEEEDTTSIETLESMTEATIYDLMGRRVETMTEGGIYIVNGKKVIR